MKVLLFEIYFSVNDVTEEPFYDDFIKQLEEVNSSCDIYFPDLLSGSCSCVVLHVIMDDNVEFVIPQDYKSMCDLHVASCICV